MARQETAEPEGTLRTELMGRLAAASFDLEARLAEISRAAGAAGGDSEARAQLAQLTALSRSVATASPASLASLRTEITANLAAASHLSQQIKTEAATGRSARVADFTALNAATRSTIESLSADLYERRIFDPYLKFDSPEDEAEYRKREAQTQRYAAEQLAKNTPEGNLNAGGALAGQILDAEAHGAGESPDFAPRWNALREQLSAQRRAVEAEGLSTEEYDRNLQASVRRFLRAKGVPEAEIEAKLKSAADPLDVAQPYMASAKDTETLKAELGANEPAAAPSTVKVSQTRANQTVDSSGLGALAATLQTSGVIITDEAQPDGHGLAAAIAAAKPFGAGHVVYLFPQDRPVAANSTPAAHLMSDTPALAYANRAGQPSSPAQAIASRLRRNAQSPQQGRLRLRSAQRRRLRPRSSRRAYRS